MFFFEERHYIKPRFPWKFPDQEIELAGFSSIFRSALRETFSGWMHEIRIEQRRMEYRLAGEEYPF